MFRINHKIAISAVLSVLVILLLGACNDVFEKNITYEKPVIIIPADKDSIAENPVHVKWQAVDGATKYRVEIVASDFYNIKSYIVDSIVNVTDFYVALDTNQYSLRVTAMNAGYTSLPSDVVSFFVGVAPTADNEVVLTSPEDKAYFNATGFDRVFDWGTIANLKNFTFELHKNDFSGELLHIKSQLETSQLTLESSVVLKEGTYSWGVKAFLIGGQESTFAKRTFYIDTTAPAKVTPLAPPNNTVTTAGTVIFSWNVPADPGTVHAPIEYLLEIANDNAFTSNLQSQTTTNTTFTVQDMETGTYYWRITPKDRAGNKGIPSAIQTLILTL